MIPKIIWQTHNYQYNELPDHVLKCAKTWQNLNPGWRYNYFNDQQRADFVKQELPDLYEDYLTHEPMYQADLWRYAVVYKYGGVYADMDSICFKPLDYMLKGYGDQDVVFSRPHPVDGKINNANFGAIRRSPSIKKSIDFIRQKKQEKPGEKLYCWECFNYTMSRKKTNIWFDAEMHSEDFKHAFPDFDVNYYGQTMNYKDYLKNILKLKGEKYSSCVN